jgi:aspartate ammonia-lyase
MTRYRVEKDFLGKVNVPSDAYYGSETERAVENFKVSGMSLQQEFIMAYVLLKRCAAVANMKAGKLDAKKGNAIVKACDEILDGKLVEQFVVDVFQAGGGTSTNMNVNEVIANRAIEILRGKKGDYSIVHPNDHVNMSQSSNDTFPTAMKMASFVALKPLLSSLELLERELARKSKEFDGIIKTGRTHLQDAVPMRMGQEFKGYEGEVEHAIKTLKLSESQLLRIPIGGTAVGTEINSDAEYKRFMIQELSKEMHIHFEPSENMFADMQSRVSELELSNSLVETAVALGKIANDLRILTSGPNSGIAEIIIPAAQPGSSIMPGKVNPSIPEMLNMVCFQVIGNGTAVREAVSAGQLELNVFEPVMIFNLLFSMKILANGTRIFAEKCIRGIKPNKERIAEFLRMDTSIATALSPYIGYSKAAEIARIAYKEKKSVIDVCLERKILDKKTLERVLDPANSV